MPRGRMNILRFVLVAIALTFAVVAFMIVGWQRQNELTLVNSTSSAITNIEVALGDPVDKNDPSSDWHQTSVLLANIVIPAHEKRRITLPARRGKCLRVTANNSGTSWTFGDSWGVRASLTWHPLSGYATPDYDPSWLRSWINSNRQWVPYSSQLLE